MKKKGIIIACSVVALVIVGVVLSQVVSWQVDGDQTSGDISKSSRFSRKTATEALTNMEELLANDENYKNSLVTTYVVMEARAQQFNALVDMSNEVAGEIPSFAGVLKDMNAARPMIENVITTLAEAGQDLNAALSGEQRPDLAQNTINASLAYTTLQKQNELANRFIAATDAYLKGNAGNDRLKFVRDQWVDYQLATAALEGDLKSAQALEEKGFLLTSEQSVSALNSFGTMQQVGVAYGEGICATLQCGSSMSSVLQANTDVFSVFNMVNDAAGQALNSVDGVHATLQDAATFSVFQQNITDGINASLKANGNTVDGTIASNAGVGAAIASNSGIKAAVASNAGVGAAIASNAGVGAALNQVDRVAPLMNGVDGASHIVASFDGIQASLRASQGSVTTMNQTDNTLGTLLGTSIKDLSVSNSGTAGSDVLHFF